MSATSTNSNADEIAFWNGRSGEKWVQYQDAQDRLLRPLGARAIAAARFAPGERVLDIGCGCGDTTLEIARIAGPDGHVTGLDVSEVMLARARERAAATAELSLDFRCADAETFALPAGSTDVIYSRFGVMFFHDPVAAFTNLSGSLGAAGRLTFVCWRALNDNPWVRIPFDVAAAHVAMPAPSEPGTPGPFAFDDAGRVERILRAAGFIDIEIDPFDTDLIVGMSLEEAVKHSMQMTPVAGPLAEAPPGTREKVSDALATALAPHAGPSGVKVGSATWIVTARTE